ncbi:MAG TPA: 50S ribosomal protein L25/general stress protein Ctc [Novosphingobium sp.]|nr:50S ribosomal protein L25/general stress protein Ctc [Novosphingobium sp.]
MSEVVNLNAQARQKGGKGPARAVRRAGSIPAVIYGAKEPPLLIAVPPKEAVRELHRPGFFTRRMTITVDGTAHEVLPRDVQLDPVTDRPVHFDFLRITKDSVIEVMVPVVFLNEAASPGLKRGGVLNIVRHELELVCDPERIPDDIVIDVTGREVGDSIHISHVTLPEGSTSAITDRDFTIATIVAPSGLRSAEGDTTKSDGE